MKVKTFAAILIMCGFISNHVGLHAQQASQQSALQTLTANSPATITINNGQRARLSFTAPSAGTYWFESSNNGTLDPVAYSAASGTDKIDDDGGEGDNFRFTRELRAGEVFTFFSYGNTTPEEVVEGWINSPGHRENILDTDFTHFGVGLTWRPEGSNARFRIYIVQNFCSFW